MSVSFHLLLSGNILVITNLLACNALDAVTNGNLERPTYPVDTLEIICNANILLHPSQGVNSEQPSFHNTDTVNHLQPVILPTICSFTRTQKTKFLLNFYKYKYINIKRMYYFPNFLYLFCRFFYCLKLLMVI